MPLPPEPVSGPREACGEALGGKEKKHLLELAHAALELGVREGRRFHPHPETNPLLEQPRAVFVSLHKAGQLRGCMGQTAARRPLHQAVADTAYSAALEDPRFEPVRPEELPEVTVEISVLSSFQAIRPEDIRVGKHGLLVAGDRARGLLLPQVAAQYHWDAQRFLEETCRKAGLEPEAWKHGAAIQAFTAEVFGDD